MQGPGITARPTAVQDAVRLGGEPHACRLAEPVLSLTASAYGINESDDGNDGDCRGDCNNGAQDPRPLAQGGRVLAQGGRVGFGLCLPFLRIA